MEIAFVHNPAPAAAPVPDVNPNWLAENRELIRMVKEVDAPELFGQDSELVFARDQDTQRMVVRVVNRRTDQVVMQLPPDYILRLARALDSGTNQPGETVAD